MSYFKAKMSKFDFGWSSATDPIEGANSAPQTQIVGFKGPTSEGGKGKGER